MINVHIEQRVMLFSKILRCTHLRNNFEQINPETCHDSTFPRFGYVSNINLKS